MGEKVIKFIGYALAVLLFAFLGWVAITEMTNEQQAKRAYQEQMIQQCINEGGSVEVKPGQYGGWSCHIPNEALKNE